ncbi:MAG: bifunctional glutamate N-acetyltransferase/amino-acid acetyltransferase ArgJ [Syntrophobacteria bacterium]
MSVPGFVAGATSAGIRYQRRPDLALIVSEVPAVAAGTFTTNRVQGAPVVLSRHHLAHGSARAIVVNSGIANACTGELGLERARVVARLTAEAIGCRLEEVLVASTGVIGIPPPLEPFVASLPKLAAGLHAQGWMDAARAIMTTDTVPKSHMERDRLDGLSFTVLGIAKGAGMICPDMATLLAFVATDVAVLPPVLQTLVREETERSFNRITVDGDTSPSDTLYVLANGRLDNRPIADLTSPAGERFRQALRGTLLNLAEQIVADGEGATKFVEIRVVGASSHTEALCGARTVANSPLVKTAFFGEDANWGRILAALGRAGIDFDPNRVHLWFNGVKLVADGLLLAEEREKQVNQILARRRFSITIDLGKGQAEEAVYTCDLSPEYVKINAGYRS